MLRQFPEQGKDLDVWLSDNLVGPNVALAHAVAQERLDGALPCGRKVYAPDRLGVVAYAAAGLSVLLFAVALWRGISPIRAAAQYARGALGPIWPLPVSMRWVEPSPRWVPADHPFDIEVRFSRPLMRNGKVLVSTGKQRTLVELKRVGRRHYRARCPAQAQRFSLQVSANDQRFRPAHFNVYPAQALRVESAAVCRADTGAVRIVLPDAFPLRVATGEQIVFRIRRDNCPVTEFGFGSEHHGDIPLHAGVDEGIFFASVTVTRNDELHLYWQHPRLETRVSPAYGIECVRNDAPSVALLDPADRSALGEIPQTMTVRGVADDVDGISDAVLHCTDFQGLDLRIGMEVTRNEDGSVSLQAEVPRSVLEGRQGDRLAFRVEAMDGSEQRMSAFSDIATLTVPDAGASAQSEQGSSPGEFAENPAGNAAHAQQSEAFADAGAEGKDAGERASDLTSEKALEGWRDGSDGTAADGETMGKTADGRMGNGAFAANSMSNRYAQMPSLQMPPGSAFPSNFPAGAALPPMTNSMTWQQVTGLLSMCTNFQWSTNMSMCTNSPTCANPRGMFAATPAGGACMTPGAGQGQGQGMAGAAPMQGMPRQSSGSGSGSVPGGGSAGGRTQPGSAEDLDRIGAAPGRDGNDEPIDGSDTPMFGAQVGSGTKDRLTVAGRGAPARERFVYRDRLILSDNRDMEHSPGTSRVVPIIGGSGNPPGAAAGAGGRKETLGPSVIESRIERNKAFLDELSPEEKRVASDYFRRLKDVR